MGVMKLMLSVCSGNPDQGGLPLRRCQSDAARELVVQDIQDWMEKLMSCQLGADELMYFCVDVDQLSSMY